MVGPSTTGPEKRAVISAIVRDHPQVRCFTFGDPRSMSGTERAQVGLLSPTLKSVSFDH